MAMATKHSMEQWLKRGTDPSFTRDDLEQAWLDATDVRVEGKSGRTRYHESSGTILVGKYDPSEDDWAITTVLIADYENFQEPRRRARCQACSLKYFPEETDGSCPKCDP